MCFRHASSFFFFTDPPTPEIYTLSLHDALPISISSSTGPTSTRRPCVCRSSSATRRPCPRARRSEEHTSELQSHHDLVCRLLLEKKKNTPQHLSPNHITHQHTPPQTHPHPTDSI